MQTTSNVEAAPSLTVWDIDTSHAAANFRVRHLMVAHVRGQLGPITGTAWIDDKDPSRSRVEASIDVRGIDTREAKRDEHLRSADFFDVEKFPSLTFRSTAVKKQGSGLALVGELTLHGVTREITLEIEELSPAVKDPWGNLKRGITAKGKLNRKDYGLGWNVALETGGILVGEEVHIELEVELTARP